MTDLSIKERRDSLSDLPLEIQKERILTRRETARIKGISDRQLSVLEARGEMPKRYKRGARAFGYKLKDLI